MKIKQGGPNFDDKKDKKMQKLKNYVQETERAIGELERDVQRDYRWINAEQVKRN